MAEVPTGRDGRPSKSLTAGQVDAVLTKTAPDRMHHYIVVVATDWRPTGSCGHCGGTRAPRRPPGSGPPVPPHIEVWRSVRPGGDTKTRRSRRTLALPARCIEALRKQRAQQAADRLAAGEPGRRRGSSSRRRAGRHGCCQRAAGLSQGFELVPGLDPEEWTPRELRHSFVSVLSDAGVPLEEISRLVGHSGTTVTELVYRHQLKPVIQTGATVMDQLFKRKAIGMSRIVTQLVTQVLRRR